MIQKHIRLYTLLYDYTDFKDILQLFKWLSTFFYWRQSRCPNEPLMECVRS